MMNGFDDNGLNIDYNWCTKFGTEMGNVSVFPVPVHKKYQPTHSVLAQFSNS